jgi:tetratricopeptide (TPR) repeat protein
MTTLLAVFLLAAAQKKPPPPPPPNTLMEVDKLLETGQAKYQKGDFAGGLVDFNHVLQIDAKSAKALSNRGLCQAGLKQFDKALLDFTKSLEIDPRHTYAFMGRGDVHLARREYEEAIKAYSLAIDSNPLQPASHALRGIAWMMKVEYAQAHPDFDRAIKLLADAKDVPGWFLRGASKHWTHEFAAAEVDLTRAVDGAPRHQQALYYRGRNRILMGKPRDAQSDLRRAVDLDPKDGEAGLALGDAYYFDGSWAEAVKAYRQAAVMDPSVDDVSRLRAWRAQMRAGEKDAAHAELEEWMKKRKMPLPEGDIKGTAEFFLGVNGENFFLAGIDQGDDRHILERRCARYADAGLMKLLVKDDAAAQGFFNKAVETGVKDQLPYAFAAAQLPAKK